MKLKKLIHCSEASYIQYVDSFKIASEAPFTANLMNLDYKAWISKSLELENVALLPSGFVPAHVFFLVDENETILGNISIRTALNDYLTNYGGHIGYVVSPKHRGQRFATKMLEMALEEAKLLGLERVLLTCDTANIASVKTILSNGGTLDSEDFVSGEAIQRYWISIA